MPPQLSLLCGFRVLTRIPLFAQQACCQLSHLPGLSCLTCVLSGPLRNTVWVLCDLGQVLLNGSPSHPHTNGSQDGHHSPASGSPPCYRSAASSALLPVRSSQGLVLSGQTVVPLPFTTQAVSCAPLKCPPSSLCCMTPSRAHRRSQKVRDYPQHPSSPIRHTEHYPFFLSSALRTKPPHKFPRLLAQNTISSHLGDPRLDSSSKV